jgi:hypothetical protein
MNDEVSISPIIPNFSNSNEDYMKEVTQWIKQWD